jgi:hypothetical protein
LINELINLEYEAKNGDVKVREKFVMRKDRYSSLSYNIYDAKQLEYDANAKKSQRNPKGHLFMTYMPPKLR